MMLVKWWFLLLAIRAIEGSLRIWPTKGSSLEEKVTKKILETCYGDNNFKDLIFILGNFNEFIDNVSIIRMNNLSDVVEDNERRSSSSIGVTKVLIIEDSPEKLYSDLISFKKTQWWNHMLPLFIIGKTDETCGNFNEILNTTWEMDILNSIYICFKSENTTLYTLNPITNYAPDPWIRMEDLNNSNIYRQIFDPHTSCKNLNYEKTKVLNGYQIKAIVLISSSDDISMEDLLESTREWSASRLFRLIIRKLNASVTYEPFEIRDFEKQLYDGYSDVKYGLSFLNPSAQYSYLLSIWEFRQIVLVKSNERTVLYKIRHLWNTRVLCVAATALIILFFILSIKNGGVTSTILDIIRFLTYVSIRTDTRSHSFRIYFTTMLIFIVISNGVFQGKIAAFLTKPDKVPPIETMEKLVDLEYHFYVLQWEYLELLSKFYPSKLIAQPLSDPDACINYVLNGTLNACIIPLDVYEENYLLEPLDSIRPQFNHFVLLGWDSRYNWPLYERFNYMLMQSFESGILENWQHKEYYKMKDRRKANDHELALAEIRPPYRPIKLVDLDFAFRLLAIGALCAMFVLIIELRMREI